jgi:2-polyprenyl-3-methyl-5-hydroxy-6-metoxy-1,4-benzoquinol methylase
MSNLKISLAAALALSVPDDSEQQQFWNEWNTRHRGADQVAHLDPATIRRRDTALRWVADLRLTKPRILDLGCSTGWLSAQLAELGDVVGTDISDASINEARERYPQIQFECANFLRPDSRRELFDVVVSVDVLSCVADQPFFIERIRQVLRPGGYVFLATPNRFVYERRDDVAPQGAGQVRRWNYRHEVRHLLRDGFRIHRFTTLEPEGHRGILRLVNSYKINGALARIASPTALERAKEKLGLGQTIVVLAQRSTNPIDRPPERRS